ncbi:hypothetical protein [Zavarzinella formosa]|uniref:hypothetical protein n=1 Tax=Zavarzinella formosa TaxID=360055 RepID=UPI000373ECFA|nr:hypothetical protein [Zavarzinella formosa]
MIRPGGTILAQGAPEDATARLNLLLAAGFQGLTIHGGRIRGFKPEHPTAAPKRLVLYKGPFRQTRDDRGNVYPRGRRVQVDEATWTLLRRGEAAEQLLFLFPFGYPAAGPVRPPVDAFAEVQS